MFKQGDPSFQLLFIMEIRIGCTYLLVVISLYVQFYGLSTMKCQLVLKLWIQNISVSDFYIQKSVRLCVHIGFRKCVYVFSFCLGFSFDYFEEKGRRGPQFVLLSDVGPVLYYKGNYSLL